MNPFTTILLATALTIIGALPFGLVNLSVLDTSYYQGSRMAIKIAHGAAIVEIFFGLSALFAGNFVLEFTDGSWFARFMEVVIPAIIGVVFFLKGKKTKKLPTEGRSGFLKGVFLNLISIQVLMYWLFVITYLNAKQVAIEPRLYLFFGIGIWTGKMLVLYLYAKLSTLILARSKTIAYNMNRIIGSVLLITALIQFFK
ncbi:MAG: hypothetical protein E4G95_01920 [Bacteroidia bacterium]|nr:MAG: hypothetical protein E4G95_01920 [Bacteroidia bacterium]